MQIKTDVLEMIEFKTSIDIATAHLFISSVLKLNFIRNKPWIRHCHFLSLWLLFRPLWAAKQCNWARER